MIELSHFEVMLSVARVGYGAIPLSYKLSDAVFVETVLTLCAE